MALTLRRQVRSLNTKLGMALAHNLLCAQSTFVGALFHADKTSTPSVGDALNPTLPAVLQVTAANAAGAGTAGIASCITLMNAIGAVLVQHLADGISTDAYSAGAHKIPDTVNAASIPAQYTATGNTTTDTAAVVAGANAQKALINLHFTQAGVHFTNDGTNTIATTNASDLATSITLLNAIKSALNPHVSSAPTTPMIKVIQ